VLSDADRAFVNSIVDTNAFETSMWDSKSVAVRKVLDFYLIARTDIPPVDETLKIRRIRAFERSCPTEISAECRRLLKLHSRAG